MNGHADGVAMERWSALDWKEQGNRHFSAAQHCDAIACYTRGLDCELRDWALTRQASPSANARDGSAPLAEPTQLALILHSNRSAAYLKLGACACAELDAVLCTQIDPTWPKGWWRKAQVFLERRQYGEATAVYEMGLRRCPSDPVLVEGLQTAQALAESVRMEGERQRQREELTESLKRSEHPQGNEVNEKSNVALLAAHQTHPTEVQRQTSEPLPGRRQSDDGMVGEQVSVHHPPRPTVAPQSRAEVAVPVEPAAAFQEFTIAWPGLSTSAESRRIVEIEESNLYATLHLKRSASVDEVSRNFEVLEKLFLSSTGVEHTQAARLAATAHDVLAHGLKRWLYNLFYDAGQDRASKAEADDQSYEVWMRHQNRVTVPELFMVILRSSGPVLVCLILFYTLFLPLTVIALSVCLVHTKRLRASQPRVQHFDSDAVV
ncbi:Stress-induced-phosphoprotein 1 [Porphyridium purpureum]|uniref:Stress-induced-phosphoprotein 1 n=1 Tax=Porphyridium purpureum TaxID=35688 RepID=A0A5J4YY27_PORPP|nr:Stress-induced-phosphoprotein 1 [Porphyridium purpureum]|eukprot:POR8461..scf209_3